MKSDEQHRHRRGIAYGLGAYGLWGLVPLYWPLLDAAGPLEILAHRVIWSLVLALLLLLLLRRRGWWRSVSGPRRLGLLVVAAALIAVNWGLYIWAVNSGNVVEAALGYYINPILSVLLGVCVLRERLARAQWVAVGVAGVAVVVLAVDYGHLPWVALILAGSFATYGLLKKQIGSGALETLTVESAVLTPVALGYLAWLQATGALVFGHHGVGQAVLLSSAGLVTLIPLLLFAAAATRLPLSTIGLLQYVTPTAQFLLGVIYFGEAMSPARWVGFGLVWAALIILTVVGLQSARRRQSAEVVEATELP
ncbi:MAG TPA: EamA family transporter RarD [Microlunatus sp.]|nr:EamA family transporter RarD [Microlunatus sp.]